VTKKIVVVGSINLDLVAYVSRMPLEGETLMGRDFATYPGGKGANQAVGAARLGGDVMMVGRLGDDIFAKQLRRELDERQVDTCCVRNVDGPSGSAVIMVTSQGGNAIVVIPGANYSLRPENLDEHLEDFCNASIILSQLEIPLETVERLGKLAADLKVPFLLDPAPAKALSPEIFRNVTWLTPNESETRSILAYLGYPVDEDLIGDDAIAAAAERLLATGVRNVILKLGSRGIYISGKDVPSTRIAPYRVTAVDTTAAGDAFNGGFAYALTHGGMSPIAAAQFASAVAAVSVTRVGAQPSMPKLSEVEEFMGLSVELPDGSLAS
jgi:ribokinase